MKPMLGKTIRYAGAVVALAGLCGVAGLVIACRASALIPVNFTSNGHCFASDQPAEVFGSFALLGFFIGALAAIAALSLRAGRARGRE